MTVAHLTQGKDVVRTAYQLNGVWSVYDDIPTFSFLLQREKFKIDVHVEAKLDAGKRRFT